jgi:hypothetical protein
MSFRQWLFGGLCGAVAVGLLASALYAKPGVVTNKQGDTFTGDVTENDTTVTVNGAGGQLTFNKANIAKIEYTATVDDEYEQRHAKLKANDVQGRIALANWANGKQRSDLAVKALNEARQIDPTNKDAAMALDAAERQMELDHPTPPAPAKPAKPATSDQGTAGTPDAPTTSTAKPAAVHRLLTNDEVNIIRQKEMTADDSKIQIKFENNVIKKYLATGDHNPKDFAALSKMDQAMAILADSDKTLAKDVKIATDPAPLLEFKTKVYPIISSACLGCHSGAKAGSFSLFPGDSLNAVYTNFYILQGYASTVDNVKYLALDRDAPDHSLVLQYGLPAKMGLPPHPAVSGWRPRFKSTDDPAYQEISDWLKNSLKVVKPDYGLNVAVSGPENAKSATKP